MTFEAIGKETDNIEAQEYVQDEEGPIEHPLILADQDRLLTFIELGQAEANFSDADLCKAASVSHHSLANLRAGKKISPTIVKRLASKAEDLRRASFERQDDDAEWIRRAENISAELGSTSRLAAKMGMTRQWVGRVMKGQRSVTNEFRSRLAMVERGEHPG
jgi:hypothetical protein